MELWYHIRLGRRPTPAAAAVERLLVHYDDDHTEKRLEDPGSRVVESGRDAADHRHAATSKTYSMHDAISLYYACSINIRI